MGPSAFLIASVLLSSVFAAKPVNRRQLWTAPKYTPSISSSFSNKFPGGSTKETAENKFTSRENPKNQSSVENDLSLQGSSSQQVETVEQYVVTKEAESYPPRKHVPSNKYDNNNGSSVEAYGGPDLTLTSRPVVYTPPHVTFHPPQIIISESGVVFTNPQTTYSHDLPSGGEDGGQMIAYQQVQLSSPNVPQNVQVSYPEMPYQHQKQAPQGYHQAYRQEIHEAPMAYQSRPMTYQPPQAAYQSSQTTYQSPQTAYQPSQAAYQPLQMAYRSPQTVSQPQYPEQPVEIRYSHRGSEPAAYVQGQRYASRSDVGKMRLKRGQPLAKKESVSPPATPHGRWPLSTLTLPPVAT